MTKEFDVNEFFRTIVDLAIENHASDIHITPFKFDTFIRFRIAGGMKTYGKVSHERNQRLINVIKTLGGLDVNEYRIPQDGKIVLETEIKGKKKNLNLRVSTMPSIYGENIVIRILISDEDHINIENLMFSPHNLSLLKSISSIKSGLVLIAGGTGSGKTTTLYSILGTFNPEEKTIFTLEEPVEYIVTGYIQSEIKNHKSDEHKIFFDFQKGLQGILRQDPDVILVGEIRNSETASMCLEVANTGHIVFASLHANSTISIISRLQQLGIKNYLIGAGLKYLIYQKLIKKLCPHCKKEKQIKLSDYYNGIHHFKNENMSVYTANSDGCEKCNGGFRGLVPINEIIKMDDGIIQMITENRSMVEIGNYVKKTNFISIVEDGIYKSVQGLADFYNVLGEITE